MMHSYLEGHLYADMIMVAVNNLNNHVKEVNDLNVFPIPDGDTGDNMLMTLRGGVDIGIVAESSLEVVAGKVAKGMLLNARGNSGVILSQFFSGISEGFSGIEAANVSQVGQAFLNGVKQAYESVMTPTEGTILTVMREASKAAFEAKTHSLEKFFGVFVDVAKQTLEKTPDMLKVLKDAGVIDSGGAGLIYIAEGMYKYLTGEYAVSSVQNYAQANLKNTLDINSFTPDSIIEYGYCTELLIRLQNIKCDYHTFDIDIIKNYLDTIGDSIVCIKDDSIVKIHVHTLFPDKVLKFCHHYGEFLTVKIENMMLQHNSTNVQTDDIRQRKNHTKFATIAVVNGEGIKNDFLSFGVDETILGGQTMNPSTDDFIKAFKKVNSDNIFVLPNNGNVILAAKQAAEMFSESNVYVVPSKTIGDAYAILSVFDYESGDPETIFAEMKASMNGVITAEITNATRTVSINGINVKEGDYISIMGKDVIASDTDAEIVVYSSLDKMNLSERALLYIIRGNGVEKSSSEKIINYAKKVNPYLEIFETNGQQELYHLYLIAD